MSNKILVLSQHDHYFGGHGYSLWKHLLEKGYEAYFLSLITLYTDDCPNYYINARKKFGLKYILYRAIRNIKRYQCPIYKGKDEYCFFNNSFLFCGNARSILKKVKVTPDIIIFTWCDFFISPKVIYDLYMITKARMIISMTDAHFLGGGCHFPCDCKQYETGCRNCPVAIKKEAPSKLYEEKVKYLSRIPLKVVGTPYDIERAQKTMFLINATFKKILDTPKPPHVMSKNEARKKMGINEGDFVVMCGGESLINKRKGFSYILDALNKFSNKIEGREVSLLLLGRGDIDSEALHLNQKIKIIKPGFLDLEQLYTAFYAADLFSSTSIDDSGPMMVNYSIACGTPVLSFPVGVSVELVKHLETGYLAKYMDVQDLANGLSLFYNMNISEYMRYSKNCLALMDDLSKNNKPWYLTYVE